MEAQELRAWLRLTLSPGVGNETARRLLAAFGSAEAVFGQGSAALRQLVPDKLVQALLTEPASLNAQWQTTLDWLAAADDRAVVALGESAYPASLLNIEDPPLMLYMLGAPVRRGQAAAHRMVKPQQHCLAMVGSRNPTPQGETNARQFAKAFGEAGMCVVSGLALGIDGAAHEGAMQGHALTDQCATIAIVGTGLDRVYPKKHLELAHRIATQGLILSEFPLGTPPLTANFPKRNRIISGLSQGVLVVEAALKSGSLITARLASEQGKDVFAIPGSIHSPQSRGCHALIKQGAKLVETALDVLEELKFPLVQGRKSHPTASDDDEQGSDESEDALLSALGFDISSLDAVQARTGLSTPMLQARLLELELDGHVARLPGGLFQRIRMV
ncbi:MAG: DNA-processing protein DprA [Pseudomonadota bacterium]